MLKQTRVEQMKRAVVERAIADESETHYGTPEGIAIVQAAKRFQRRNFLERVASLVFQRWREESAKRNDVLLALKSAFIEENEARRLRAAFRVWPTRHGDAKAKHMAIQRNASYCSFDVVVPIAKENIYNDERER